MRNLFLTLIICAALSIATEDYFLPGIETDVINISVNVWGEVRNPGLHLIPWDSDLRDALSAAGGPLAEADLSCVRIVTSDIEIEYNLSDFLNGRGAPVPAMEPDVTVYVGRSNYEWWKDAVDFGYKILIMANVIWVMSR